MKIQGSYPRSTHDATRLKSRVALHFKTIQNPFDTIDLSPSVLFGNTSEKDPSKPSLDPIQKALAQYFGLEPETMSVTLDDLRTAFLIAEFRQIAEIAYLDKTKNPRGSVKQRIKRQQQVQDYFDKGLYETLRPLIATPEEPLPDYEAIDNFDFFRNVIFKALDFDPDEFRKEMNAQCLFGVIQKLGIPKKDLQEVSLDGLRDYIESLSPESLQTLFQLE